MKRLVTYSLLALLTACAPSNSAEQRYVLAISWQPAFCETRSKVRECKSQHAGRADARQFSLHGLWPQPVSKAYCGVPEGRVSLDKSGQWRRIEMDRLPPELWNRLKIAMPGTMSGLERHEWIKHGTCLEGATAETYFDASLALLDAINVSPLRDLFAGNVGGELTGRQIRRAFDNAFGDGAGERVRIACKRDGDRRLINELTISLSTDLAGGLSTMTGDGIDLAKLIAAAPKTDPGCPGGVVDPVGLQ